MTRLPLTLCVCIAAALPAALPAAAQAGAPAVNMQVGKVESTLKPHPGTSVQWGRAVVLIDAPIDHVMAAIQNYGAYKSFLPNCEDSRVLAQRGASALVYVKVTVMHGAANLWAEVKLRPRPAQGNTRIIEGSMTRGNMDHFEAVWEATPVDGRTLVAFQILVDPDLPVPASLVDRENERSANKALRALRDLLAKRK